jgi:O-antigen/teichoic acid export membrane protein
MGIVLRQSAKTVLITYIAFALGYINTLFLSPLVLSKEEIGLVRVLINVSYLFATLASLGSANIPMKFFPYFKDRKLEHNGILFFILTIGTAGFSLFVTFILAFKPYIANIYSGKAPLLMDYFYYLIPFTLIAIYSIIFDSYIVIQQRPVVPNFIKEFLIRAFMTIWLVLLFFKMISFKLFVINIILGYALALIILILYIWSLGLLFLKPNFTVFKSSHFKSIVVFAGFALMGNAGGTLIGNIDSLILSAYKGLGSTGIFTIAFFIATTIEIPKRAISQAVIPHISESNKNNEIEKLDIIYKKSSINQMIVGGVLFLLVWCNIDGIFHIIPHGEDFITGKWVVFWIGLSKLFDMATGVNQEIIGTSRFYKMDLAFYSLLVIIGIVTGFIFIPLYGLTGAALSVAISTFLINIIRFFFILFSMKIQPFSFDSLKILCIGGAVYLTDYLLPHNSSFIIDLITRSILLLIMFATLVLLLKVSEDINIVVHKLVKKYIGKRF